MSEITKFEATSIANISDFVQIKDEQVYTTSRIVAEKFGKEHKNVIRDIEATISTINEAQVIENKARLKFELSENISGLKNQSAKNDYFVESSYIDSTGRTLKQYLITEDGLALLVMGFGGVNAMRIKLKFVAEFNRMKNIINNPAQVIAETGSLDALVAFGVTNQRFTNALVKAKQEQQLLEQQKREAENELVAQKAIFYDRIVPGIQGMHGHIYDLTNERDEAIADYEGLYNHYINSDGWFKMSEVAGKLNIHGMGRNKIFSILRERHVLDRRNLPYRQFIESGMFMIKDTDIMVGNRIKTVSTTFVSKKGQVFIEKLLRKLGYC